MNNKKPIIYKELSHDIIGAAMQVHNELGPGWDEEAYHLAMVKILGASPEAFEFPDLKIEGTKQASVN